MRALCCLLGLLLPPLGLFPWFGSAAVAWIISALWVAGVLIFWFLWAGPGLVLAGLASLCACVAILFMRRSSSMQRAS